jgi:hypothetical protein
MCVILSISTRFANRKFTCVCYSCIILFNIHCVEIFKNNRTDFRCLFLYSLIMYYRNSELTCVLYVKKIQQKNGSRLRKIN